MEVYATEVYATEVYATEVYAKFQKCVRDGGIRDGGIRKVSKMCTRRRWVAPPSLSEDTPPLRIRILQRGSLSSLRFGGKPLLVCRRRVCIQITRNIK